MKNLAAAMIVGAGVMAGVQWWQIAYRLRLFFVDYHSERGMNHIGDGDFTLIYIANLLLLAAAVFGVRAFWHDARGWRISGLVVSTMNAVGCLCLFVMHRTGVLVEYGEFIRHWQGGA